MALMQYPPRPAREVSRPNACSDFTCDALKPDSGTYTLELAHPRHGTAVATCTLGESTYLGTICLSAGASNDGADQLTSRGTQRDQAVPAPLKESTSEHVPDPKFG